MKQRPFQVIEGKGLDEGDLEEVKIKLQSKESEQNTNLLMLQNRQSSLETPLFQHQSTTREEESGDFMRILTDNPRCDYTPPELITLIVSDSHIMTPAAVSEELIQMFNL